ncbi:MAG: response regulator transcription factor [Gammaproteobacteria bacterium]|nr:response regulator transcription factor [Gammaproteobacteria bacterium]
MKSVDATLVYVVDDDDAVRDSLRLLLRSVDLPSRTFASADEFLANYDADVPSCLIADIRMPGMSGLELQEELNRRKVEMPLIFITGHGDVPMAVKAMQAGAMDFIQKPFRDQDLLDRVYRALQQDSDKREARKEARRAQHGLDQLTPRETEVMERVVRGQANKVIAQDLGVSQRTVELHRARVMHKMGVRSLADLVRLVGTAKQL